MTHSSLSALQTICENLIVLRISETKEYQIKIIAKQFLTRHIMRSKQIRTEVTWVNPTKSKTNVEIFCVQRRLQREYTHSIFFWMSRTNSLSTSRPLSVVSIDTSEVVSTLITHSVFDMLSKDPSAERSMKTKPTPYFKNKKSRSKRHRGKIVQCKKWKDRPLQSEILDKIEIIRTTASSDVLRLRKKS